MWTRILSLTCLSVLSACTHILVPLAGPYEPRPRVLSQREFRLGAFDFGRAEQGASELGNAIPAMLLTELRNGGRFATYEGGNLRFSDSEPLNEANASQYMDGYLSGTFTSLNAQQACIDLRLSNAVTHEVLYTRPVCIAISETGQIDRDAVTRLAEEIARAIKQVGNGNVTSADGRIVFCDKGRRAGVKRGMVAYLVGTGDSVRDPAIHKEVKHYTGADPAQLTTPVIVGEMYVVSVEDNYSVAMLYKGNYALPGDTVFFK